MSAAAALLRNARLLRETPALLLCRLSSRTQSWATRASIIATLAVVLGTATMCAESQPCKWAGQREVSRLVACRAGVARLSPTCGRVPRSCWQAVIMLPFDDEGVPWRRPSTSVKPAQPAWLMLFVVLPAGLRKS
jgi:hypothetical protein